MKLFFSMLFAAMLLLLTIPVCMAAADVPQPDGQDYLRTITCNHELTEPWKDAGSNLHYSWCSVCSSTVYAPHTGNGNCAFVCADCGAKGIDPNGNHTFSEWGPISATQHGRYCTACQLESTKQYADHKGNGNCVSACVDCGYFVSDPNGKHNMSEWDYLSETQHSRHCTRCGSNYEYESHKGDGTCKPICTECKRQFTNPNGTHSMSEWSYDDSTQHSRMCTVCRLDSTLEYGDHYGGEATCAEKAICEGCNTRYGERSNIHGEMSKWEFFDGGRHFRHCTVCNRVAADEFGEHSGGTATCSQLAICEHCDAEYGDYNGSNHSGYVEWQPISGTQHYRYCQACRFESVQYANHISNDGSCWPTCTVCGYEYYDPNGKHLNMSEWTANVYGQHERICLDCFDYIEYGEHTGGTASCGSGPICEVCSTEYGEAEGNHIPGAAADCTNDQICINEGCGMVLTEKLGHDYEAVVTKPTCVTKGYTTYTCTRCSDRYKGDYTAARNHWYDLWTPNADRTHSAVCKYYDCSYTGTTDCTLFEVTVKNGETEVILTVCPVCGDHAESPFDVIHEAVIKPVSKNALYRGEQIVRGKDAPFEGVLYAFSAAYEYGGKVDDFKETVSITLPINAEKYAEFKLVRVDVTPATETAERTEVWTDIAFTCENGELTFETDTMGLFLLVPVE